MRTHIRIGYILENLFLQPKSLEIFYETKFFTTGEILQLTGKRDANTVATARANEQCKALDLGKQISNMISIVKAEPRAH